MNNQAVLLSTLSPERRALLAQRIRERDGKINAFPLSFAQQRLWFLERLNPKSGAYNIATALRLTGRLNIEALCAAVNEILRRHEILRTTILSLDGDPMQVVEPELEARPELIDLTGLSREVQEREVRRVIAEESQTGFDLSQGPLFRAKLVREGVTDHALVVVMHHIVSDGWSMGILVKEFEAFYTAFDEGKPSPLPELSIQYIDYAVWQRKMLQGEMRRKLVGYWKGQLQGRPLTLELPTDRKRPPVQTFRGGRFYFELGVESASAMRALSKREGATIFITMIAAFTALLYRYTGQEYINIGTPIAGRRQLATEALIGFFVNTLVISAGVSGDLTVLELVRRVRQVVLDAYAHQDLPFEKLVEEVQPQRDLSVSPVIQVMFAMENGFGAQLKLPGLMVNSIEMENKISKYDLTAHVGEKEEGMIGCMEYNLDLFDEETIRRMVAHFGRLLIDFGGKHASRVAELEIMTEDERKQLLLNSEGLRRQYQTGMLMHQLIEEQAARRPEATALISGDERLSYRELDEMGARIANFLGDAGVGPGQVVGICMERGIEAVAGIIGVLKAGAAYVPMDPQYPRERLAYLVNDSGSQVILTQRKLRSLAPEAPGGVICVDSAWETTSKPLMRACEPKVDEESPAYILYTSGTTGKPKGAIVTHRNIVNFLETVKGEFAFSESDVMPFIAPFTFDISLFELFGPLVSGGTTLILNKDVVLDMERLARLLEKVTLLHTVPSLMRQLVDYLSQGSGIRPSERFGGMRKIFIGGDQVPADLLDRMRDIFTGSDIHVLYGPTEATVVCASYHVPRNAKLSRQILGKPLSNMTIRLYDKDRNLAPAEVAGEIYIGGAGVSRGYLNHEELTAEKFVMIAGERFYRSGDLGRYHKSKLEFLGRIDDQVKVRGMRVEPAEVEMALRESLGVTDALVTIRKDRSGENMLVGYVVVNDATSEGELRSRLKDKLPEYMVPGAIMMMESLPTTVNGKVDKRALPAPGDVEFENAATRQAPRNATEHMIARIWEETLGRNSVGTRDNFFDLGGHSLLVVRAHSKLQEQLGREISIVDLFKYPTIESLALHLAGGNADGSESNTDAPEAEQAVRRKSGIDRQRQIRNLRRATGSKLEAK